MGDQLARQLPPHARASPGDDGNLSGKILHGDPAPFRLQFFLCNFLGAAIYSAASMRVSVSARNPSSAALIAACCAGEASGIGAREKVLGKPCSDCE